MGPEAEGNPMKTTKELKEEARERAKTRFAERKEIQSACLSIRLEAGRANEEIGQHSMAAVTSDALSTADRALSMVDQAMDHFDTLRLELIQIALGERWHQNERPPQTDTLTLELGELTALLKVREVLARTESAR